MAKQEIIDNYEKNVPYHVHMKENKLSLINMPYPYFYGFLKYRAYGNMYFEFKDTPMLAIIAEEDIAYMFPDREMLKEYKASLLSEKRNHK